MLTFRACDVMSRATLVYAYMVLELEPADRARSHWDALGPILGCLHDVVWQHVPTPGFYSVVPNAAELSDFWPQPKLQKNIWRRSDAK